MKSIKTHLATLAALFSATVLAHAGPSTFVRYHVDATMTASGIDADATGRVQAFLKHQGSSDNRRLRVRVTNLDPSATFTLQAVIGDASEAVAVATFTTDAAGKAVIVYLENTSLRSAARVKPSRKNKRALPEDIFDIASVRVLNVVNANSEIVLSADLHATESFNYQVATAFKNTGTDGDAIGCMAAAVQSGTIQFRLFAMGQSSQYTLVINNEPVANYTADLMGGIAVGSYPSLAPEPMKFREISLKNSADVVILESHVQ
ncbi:MAG TPA: hypothetical protein VK530_17460 [Candidatus Acidoferrum sp.]|nr:hypothetical protein [Candidatus Acidoferrum sp.]